MTPLRYEHNADFTQGEPGIRQRPCPTGSLVNGRADLVDRQQMGLVASRATRSGAVAVANQPASRTVQIEVDSRRTQFLGSRLPLLLGRTVSIASFAPEITMEATTALPAPAHAQIPTSLTETHTPPAVPAHLVQAALPAIKPMPASPAPSEAAAQTAPPAAPVTPPAVVVPAYDVTANTTVDHNTPTPAPIDTGVEATLSAEITKLLTDRKNGNASVRRTRAELKSLRQQLSEKLHSLKAILVGTGREGGWAPYLREQKLPLATANRYVAAHQAKLAQPAEKLLTEQHVEPTADDARKLAVKLLPTLSRTLTTQELVFEFVHELLWSLDVAEVTDTDNGLEIPRTAQDDSGNAGDDAAELASPVPAVP